MGNINWFSLGSAEKLLQEANNHGASEVRKVLLGRIYSLFQEKIQINHLQLHHYCQPRQNESMQGRFQFDDKNQRTLEPVITELENLFINVDSIEKYSYVFLHLADANLDELFLRRQDLLVRLQALTQTGYLKIAGGILDEAFIGPDSIEFTVAAITAYFDKIIQMFGENSVAPLMWIPERFFEEKTAKILDLVYKHYPFLKKFKYLSLIVDQNVIEHSLPNNWNGNVFTGWVNTLYPSLRIFTSSNHLRAIMPKAGPIEVNDYFFSLFNSQFDDKAKDNINWFIANYEQFIEAYYQLNNGGDFDAGTVLLEIDRFFLKAKELLEKQESLFVYFVDDLEKNGSWEGMAEFAFGNNRNFYQYIRQAQNIFNPYQMTTLESQKPKLKSITKINPSSYKEFSIVWNNNPMDVENWRRLTLLFIKNNINSIEEIEALSSTRIKELGLTKIEIKWYVQFVTHPISWEEGQLIKYPEIKINYYLAQHIYEDIVPEDLRNEDSLRYLLHNDGADIGHLLHIWNKNRASCPNFIGFFGGASILFFRLHIAAQLAAALTLKHKDQQYVIKDVGPMDSIHWTLVKSNDDFRVIDGKGDSVFVFSQKNLHSLASGFCRHREGYDSIIQNLVMGRTDVENFALVETKGGTTSAHPLMIALDLGRIENEELIKKTYPVDLDYFDNEQDMLYPYPTAWEQVWVLPANSVDDPILNYQEGYFGQFKWRNVSKYEDVFDGKKYLTFVREGFFNRMKIEVIKKIDTTSHKVLIEIWNRSNIKLSFNPVIAFPTSLDWFEGENYSVEGESLPLNGETRVYNKSSISVEDRISNTKLGIKSKRDDVRFYLTTSYTYQTSDVGAYTVSPQHELILLGSRDVVTLNPDEGYLHEYEIENSEISRSELWQIDYNSLPEILKNKIRKFSEIFLDNSNFTNYQKQKLIYARYPEIVFWAK